jgi:hypothetical protein
MPASVLNKWKKMDLKRKKKNQNMPDNDRESSSDSVFLPPDDEDHAESKVRKENDKLINENMEMTEQLKERDGQIDDCKDFLMQSVWESVKHIEDDDERAIQYDTIGATVEERFRKMGVELPTYQEALEK